MKLDITLHSLIVGENLRLLSLQPKIWPKERKEYPGITSEDIPRCDISYTSVGHSAYSDGSDMYHPGRPVSNYTISYQNERW